MENKIKTIREACIKANDSIKDLVFGCEYKDIHNITHTFINNAGRDTHRYLSEGVYGELLNIFTKEIIGRPIRLADVLLAIHEKNTGNLISVTISSDGQFIIRRIDKTLYTKEYWNLEDDNLENQSEECIEFIHNLIN